MRISSSVALCAVLALAFGQKAMAFDGAPVNDATPVAAAAIAPGAPGTAAATKQALPSATSLSSLQYAAEGGHPVAQWKLGQMYASGNGVTRDDLRAFEYFSNVANAHAEDPPSAPQAKIVANAFVSLGQYYLAGIPNTRVAADPERAREMFAYAASYFGDADAQYNLGRLYLNGADRDPKSAARWLNAAAIKGQHQAQALLGQMLFNGDRVPRQAAKGLMWLLLAKENATAEETWIVEAYNRSLAKASEDDRAMAGQMLSRWVQGKKD